MPTPRRERLYLAAALLSLTGAAMLLAGIGATPRHLAAAALVSVAVVVYGAAEARRGRRTATDADVEAAAYAWVDAALRDTAAWNAWCKRTNNDGWVQSSDRAAIRQYLRDTLTPREDQA
jgi:hypothetical protein